ncbi:MAG TPA: hemerythrin domain-containing protein [Oligoflexia bacterium]|nr:hemerythrin domain-containing protein [Oligoflexia bacterium]HMR25169.1 hemerythrin domain-containing protein [Oligoflexia bacterium]
MNIFESLRKDHDLQRKLIDQLSKTSGDSKVREKIFSQLKLELSRHAKCEERFFYNPLIKHDQTQELSRHSIAEHKEIDDYLEILENTNFDSPAWLKTLKNLKHRLLHHLDEEEHEFFQQAGKVLNNNQKENLAEKYENLMIQSSTEVS